MKRIFLLLSVVTFAVVSACSNVNRPVSSASPSVRILLDEAEAISIETAGSFIFEIEKHTELGSGTVTVSLTDLGMSVNGVVLSELSFDISPEEGFSYDGTDYRGTARFVNSGKEIQLINVVDLESYLYGVVPAEIPATWELEALKAQAVVARTYALYEITEKVSDQDYDLYCDTRSQVYGGKSGENKFTTAAVDATMGEVLFYGDEIIKSYFHACTGGMTASADEVFCEERPYLKVVESPWGVSNESYIWETNFSFAEITEALDGQLSGNLISINVLDRTDSQRIGTVELISDDGDTETLTGAELRAALGYSALKSTRANLIVQNQTAFFFGVGYGHGVGMGQADAHGMAQDGKNYTQILKLFYPGTKLETMW